LGLFVEMVDFFWQGTAADMIKQAMIRLHTSLVLKKLKSSLVLQVHDELVLLVPEQEIPLIVPLIREAMEFPQLKVSTPVVIKIGKTLATDDLDDFSSWTKKKNEKK